MTRTNNHYAPLINRAIGVIASAMLWANVLHAGGYSGNNILEILGEYKNSGAVASFKTQYLLDRSLKNPLNGIRLSCSHDDSLSIVIGLTLAAEDYTFNNITYKQFSGAIPFGINFADNEESLIHKFGKPKTVYEEKMKFRKEGITINIYFKNANRKKIDFVRFTQQIGALSPYRLDGSSGRIAGMPDIEDIKSISLSIEHKDNITPSTTHGTTHPTTATNLSHREQVMREIAAKNNMPMPAQFSKSTAPPPPSKRNHTQLYSSILSVFESGEEEMFKDIKRGSLSNPNFWSYKYVYTTSLSIPGEKYNMLYSYPFQTSQLDFVSVIDEGDGGSVAIQSRYSEFESKLKDEFRPDEGWTMHYITNDEDPKGLKDLEIKNPRLGSVVLDHSTNPYGKKVLYLRFLLQYN